MFSTEELSSGDTNAISTNVTSEMKFYIKYVTKLMVTEIYPTYSPMTTSLQKFITDVAETYSSRKAIR